MIVRTPDGKWAVYSPTLRILTRVGLDERDALSAASEELGSIDKARAALADVGTWDAVLRLMDEPTRRALARRYGVEAPPPAPEARHRAENAAAKLKALEARKRRAAARRAAAVLRSERRRAERAGARAQRAAEREAAARARQAAKEARAKERRRARSERTAQVEEARPPRKVYTPEERAEAHRIASRAHYRATNAEGIKARADAAAHARAQRVAAYLLFGSCSRAANLCGCAPTSVDDALRAAGIVKTGKRTPLAAEVERTMRNYGFGEKAITRALRHAAP